MANFETSMPVEMRSSERIEEVRHVTTLMAHVQNMQYNDNGFLVDQSVLINIKSLT